MERKSNLPATRDVQVDSQTENNNTETYAPIFPKATKRRTNVNAFEIQYEEHLATSIAYLVGEGLSLSVIASLPGMPSVYQMMCWRRGNQSFREMLATAREARAEILVDGALEIASKSKFSTKEVDKTAIDTALKVAAALDPETYGSRTKLTGDPNAPLSFLISTGISRPGDGLEPIEVKLDKSDPAKLTEKKEDKDHAEEAEVEENIGPGRGFGV